MKYLLDNASLISWTFLNNLLRKLEDILLNSLTQMEYNIHRYYSMFFFHLGKIRDFLSMTPV